LDIVKQTCLKGTCAMTTTCRCRCSCRRSLIVLAIIFAIAFASPVDAHAAGPQVMLAQFAGQGGPAVRAKVANELCGSLDCVPEPSSKKNAPRTAVLAGRVVRAKKSVTLELTLLNAAGKQVLQKGYPLNADGSLAADNVTKIVRAVTDALPHEAAPPPHPAAPASTPAAAPATATSAAAPSSPPATAQPSTAPAAATTAGGAATAKRDHPLFSAALALDMVRRTLSFDNVAGTRALIGYATKGLVPAPRLTVDFFPLDLVTTGILTNIGLEMNLSFTLGVKAGTAVGAVQTSYPSQLLRLDVAAFMRIPLPLGGLVLIPSVGFKQTSFWTSAADSGATLTELPDVAYSGFNLALGAEVPLLDDDLRLGARFGYIPVVASGAVISRTYFPHGSTWGLEADVDASYRILSMLAVRVDLFLTHYSLSFDAPPTSLYVASGAADSIYGASLSAVYLFY
jgi:hypothetical protein